MKYYIAKFIFFLAGWKLKATPELIQRAQNTVTVAAPHTSNQDLIFSLGAFWLMRLPLKFLIKDFYTKWYFLGFFKWLGGIGVNREQRSNIVEHSAEILRSTDFNLMISPEGTRKFVDKWKTGFYHIAVKGGVDISLGFLDYKEKKAGLLDVVTPGELDSTMKRIQTLYKPISGKNPELFNTNLH